MVGIEGWNWLLKMIHLAFGLKALRSFAESILNCGGSSVTTLGTPPARRTHGRYLVEAVHPTWRRRVCFLTAASIQASRWRGCLDSGAKRGSMACPGHNLFHAVHFPGAPPARACRASTSTAAVPRLERRVPIPWVLRSQLLHDVGTIAVRRRRVCIAKLMMLQSRLTNAAVRTHTLVATTPTRSVAKVIVNVLAPNSSVARDGRAPRISWRRAEAAVDTIVAGVPVAFECNDVIRRAHVSRKAESSRLPHREVTDGLLHPPSRGSVLEQILARKRC